MNTEIDVQDVFNRVIANNYYNETVEFMCHALNDANECKVITNKEYFYCKMEIQQYLMGISSALENCLLYRGLPRTFEDRLAIYRDWKNRPKLTS